MTNTMTTTIDLARVPKRRRRGSTRIVSAVVPNHIAAWLHDTAQREGTSVSQLITHILAAVKTTE